MLGGHIDSWDVGQGAMDDGGGLVVAWEALNLIKKLGLKPKRTIRVVGWTNEENGGRGGLAYREAHKARSRQARARGGVRTAACSRRRASDSPDPIPRASS